MKNNLWMKTGSVVITVFIVLMIFVLVSHPFLVQKYADFTEIQMQNINLLIAFLYITALPFIILLFAAKIVCKNILNKEPFCERNIVALNIISVCAFIDFLLYALGTIIILRSLLSLIIMVAAFMVGLTGLILSQLVRYAMDIKQENDLTI